MNKAGIRAPGGLRPWLPWLGLVAALLLPLLSRTAYGLTLFNLAAIHAVLAVGFYVIFGLTGVLSIAQAAFWGLGAYASAIATATYGWPVWASFLLAPAVAALAGLVLALPTLKLKTHYLTMATIGFAEVTRQVFINWDKMTKGPTGIGGIPAPAPFGLSLADPGRYYYLSLLLLALVIAVVLRLRSSRLGRGLEAIRDDELAAEAMGVNVTGLKLLAFAVSAAISGLAGAQYAHLVRYISPDIFHLEATILLLAMVMIGGRTSVAGAVVGAVVLTYLPEALRAFKDWYLTIYGAGMLLALAFMPEGLVGAALRLWQRWGRSRWGRPGMVGRDAA